MRCGFYNVLCPQNNNLLVICFATPPIKVCYDLHLRIHSRDSNLNEFHGFYGNESRVLGKHRTGTRYIDSVRESDREGAHKRER